MAPPVLHALLFVSLFAIGAFLGSLLNLGIYRLAWYRRSISPWSRPSGDAPPRNRWDRLPIFGWLALRREAPIYGRGFWLRPMIIEFACGMGLPLLYWWEVLQHGLVAELIPVLMPPLKQATVVVPPTVIHLELLSHSILIALMIVASFIDIDEKLIPDEITIPGTLLGLSLAAALPWSLLPQVNAANVQPQFSEPLFTAPGIPAVTKLGVPIYQQFLTLSAPLDWPNVLRRAPRLGSLALGLACYWLWCFAIAPRTWYSRHGWGRAWRLFIARLIRDSLRLQKLLLISFGTLGVLFIWWIGGVHWAGLLTALVGLAVGGGVVWAVRLIGASALKKEAMGFGDVTLMMMIGTFVGWQPCLIIFFVAPFAGLLIGVIQWLLIRDQVIPYGPFLCLATLATIVRWGTVWDRAKYVFGIGWLVPVVLIFCFIAMWAMLSAWHLFIRLLGKAMESRDL